MKKFLTTLLIGAYACGLVATAVPLVAHADAFGLDDTAKQTPFAGSKKTIPQLVGSLLSVALSLIGLIFLGLAVYGGFMWMTARGDEGKVKEGRETLINASIGIILIVTAYAITNFVFTNVIPTISS